MHSTFNNLSPHFTFLPAETDDKAGIRSDSWSSHLPAQRLWLSISPHLKCFDQRLLSQLAKFAQLHRWEYIQSADEPCSIEQVIGALHEYLQTRPRKVHLIGHGTSGIVALLYARRYPHRVASLTLLSVGANPAISWQAHYYALRRFLPCSREIVLAQMARLLFGAQPQRFTIALSKLLARDLDSNLSLHSLVHHEAIAPGGVEVPLLVCYGAHDVVFQSQGSPRSKEQGQEKDKESAKEKVPTHWHSWLKPGDRLWACPNGKYFFHFNHPIVTASRISDFWQQITPDEARENSSAQVLRV